jgi:hypothetical protein
VLKELQVLKEGHKVLKVLKVLQVILVPKVPKE